MPASKPVPAQAGRNACTGPVSKIPPERWILGHYCGIIILLFLEYLYEF